MKLLSKKLLTKIKRRQDALIIMQINDWCNSNKKKHKECYEAEGYFWTKGFTQQELANTLDIPLRSLQRCLNRITSYDESNFIVKRLKLVKEKDGKKKIELWYRPNYPYICNHIDQELPLPNESESQTANLAATARIDVPPPPKVAESYKEESFINLLPSSSVPSSNPKKENGKSANVTSKESIKVPLHELKKEDVMAVMSNAGCHLSRLDECYLAFMQANEDTPPKPLEGKRSWKPWIKKFVENGEDRMRWSEPVETVGSSPQLTHEEIKEKMNLVAVTYMEEVLANEPECTPEKILQYMQNRNEGFCDPRFTSVCPTNILAAIESI